MTLLLSIKFSVMLTILSLEVQSPGVVSRLALLTRKVEGLLDQPGTNCNSHAIVTLVATRFKGEICCKSWATGDRCVGHCVRKLARQCAYCRKTHMVEDS